MTDIFVPPAMLTPPPTPVAQLEGETVAAWARELLWTAAENAPRSRQQEVGPSQLGLGCSRQIAHQVAGTTPVNLTVDPWASVVGTAMHAWTADVFRSLNSARFLVEHRVSYKGINGTCDLYDRRNGRVIDWKFPKLAKVRKLRADGPPRHYVWQVQTYAAGLAEQGENPVRVVIVSIPVDGPLTEASAWSYPFNRAEADEAIDRLATIRQQLHEGGSPAGVLAQPSRLCPWCPYHRPGWDGDLDVACPGKEAA